MWEESGAHGVNMSEHANSTHTQTASEVSVEPGSLRHCAPLMGQNYRAQRQEVRNDMMLTIFSPLPYQALLLQ